MLVNLGLELLLELGVHPGDVRDVALQARHLLLLLKQFLLHFDKRFPLKSGNSFHLVVDHRFAFLELLILILQVNKPHPHPINIRITRLPQVLILRHILQKDRELLVVMQLLLRVFQLEFTVFIVLFKLVDGLFVLLDEFFGLDELLMLLLPLQLILHHSRDIILHLRSHLLLHPRK